MALGKESDSINVLSQVKPAAQKEEQRKKFMERLIAAGAGGVGAVVAASNDAIKNVPSELAPSPFLDAYLAARKSALNRAVGGS